MPPALRRLVPHPDGPAVQPCAHAHLDHVPSDRKPERLRRDFLCTEAADQQPCLSADLNGMNRPFVAGIDQRGIRVAAVKRTDAFMVHKHLQQPRVLPGLTRRMAKRLKQTFAIGAELTVLLDVHCRLLAESRTSSRCRPSAADEAAGQFAVTVYL